MYVCMCSRAHHKVTPDNTHHADPGLSFMTSNIPVSHPTPNKKQREGEREERESERGKREPARFASDMYLFYSLIFILHEPPPFLFVLSSTVHLIIDEVVYCYVSRD